MAHHRGRNIIPTTATDQLLEAVLDELRTLVEHTCGCPEDGDNRWDGPDVARSVAALRVAEAESYDEDAAREQVAAEATQEAHAAAEAEVAEPCDVCGAPDNATHDAEAHEAAEAETDSEGDTEQDTGSPEPEPAGDEPAGQEPDGTVPDGDTDAEPEPEPDAAVEPEPDAAVEVEVEADATAEVDVSAYHTGGGWYELPDGTKVRGEDAARDALTT